MKSKWAYPFIITQNKHKRNRDTLANKGGRRISGFTIVELLIVVVVIAILAAIVTVAYNGITSRARQSAADEAASQNRTKLALNHVETSTYPANPSSLGLTGTYEYSQTGGGTGYCLTTYSDAGHAAATKIENGIATSDAVCTGHSAIGSGDDSVGAITDGALMQAITNATCPASRTRAVDARDNHTYWVQKLADGKCWMLTNLGYAGGGTNAYADVKTLTNGTGGFSTYTAANYYIVPSTVNYTTEPAAPSTATNGTGQYGYLYNWCAAMGAQTGTSACANATTPAASTSLSVCPAGWRLPTGSGGELLALNAAVNSGSTNSDAGLLTTGLMQRGGYWNSSFLLAGSSGYYWSSTPGGASVAYKLGFTGSSVNNAADMSTKSFGHAVRCLAV